MINLKSSEDSGRQISSWVSTALKCCNCNFLRVHNGHIWFWKPLPHWLTHSIWEQVRLNIVKTNCTIVMLLFTSSKTTMWTNLTIVSLKILSCAFTICIIVPHRKLCVGIRMAGVLVCLCLLGLHHSIWSGVHPALPLSVPVLPPWLLGSPFFGWLNGRKWAPSRTKQGTESPEKAVLLCWKVRYEHLHRLKDGSKKFIGSLELEWTSVFQKKIHYSIKLKKYCLKEIFDILGHLLTLLPKNSHI